MTEKGRARWRQKKSSFVWDLLSSTSNLKVVCFLIARPRKLAAYRKGLADGNRLIILSQISTSCSPYFGWYYNVYYRNTWHHYLNYRYRELFLYYYFYHVMLLMLRRIELVYGKTIYLTLFYRDWGSWLRKLIPFRRVPLILNNYIDINNYRCI